MNGFAREVKVDFHDVDFNGVCRASSLMKYMQSTAQLQLNSNNMSYEQLQDMGRAFILSKIKLEFTEPVYAEQLLEAVTFPCHSRGFSFLRCYQLSRDGIIVGRGVSVWALIDTATHGLVKVSDFELGLTTYEPLRDIELSHVRFPTEMREVGSYKVAYADLDQNRHVNNTKYPDIYANFLPLDNKRISSLTISYMNEAKFGECLKVFLACRDGIYYIRTQRADGKINSEAEVILTDI